MKRKDKKRLSTTAAIMWRITALALALWLGAMVYLTLLSARQIRDDMHMRVEAYTADSPQFSSRLEMLKNMQDRSSGWMPLSPFYDDMSIMLEEHHFGRKNQYYFNEDGILFGDGTYGLLELVADCRTETGTLAMTPTTATCYVDLNKTPPSLEAFLREHLNVKEGEETFSCPVLRMTGYFDGYEWIPLKAAYGDGESWVEIQPDEMEWTVLFEQEEQVEQPLLTVYSYVGIPGDTSVIEQDDEPVVYHGMEYESFQKLAEEAEQYDAYGRFYIEESTFEPGSLWEDVLVYRGEHRIGKRDATALFSAEDEAADRYEPTNLDSAEWVACVVVARYYPVGEAMMNLLSVYLITLLIIGELLLLLRRGLKKHLAKPLENILHRGQKDYALLTTTYQSPYREIYEVEQGYEQMQKDIQALRQENQQLKTRMDYAENAEANRRRMVSDITHELKTPLAVIHSYAEGLSEDIAAHKRQKYLDVILDEAERMDGMVLEMLDLSRLEAGKSKLSQDRFSLLGLTRQVMERLERMVQERNLTVEYNLCYDFDILADEARIEQVITNLASNAVKYTSEGGKIAINILQNQGECHFIISNECAPLPQETLDHIWESFYRSDASRKVKGTGLGLAIAKTIIELHRGTCSVSNIQNGVEFRFTLPA